MLTVRLKDVFGKQQKEKQQWLLSDKNRQVQHRTSQTKTVKVAKNELRNIINFVSFIFAKAMLQPLKSQHFIFNNFKIFQDICEK